MCMQSGGGAQQGHGRSPASAASPSSSSSAVSHLGFDAMQHSQPQHHHHQLIGSRMSLQQQLLRKPEGNEALLAAYQGGATGFMGGNSFASSSGSIQMVQQFRKCTELGQQHGYSQIQDETQNKGQQMLNHVQQAHLQYALQAAHQRSSLGMHSQQQGKLGTIPSSSVKEQDMRLANPKTPEFMSTQAPSGKTPSEQLIRNELQMEPVQQMVSDPKFSSQQIGVRQMMPGNMARPMQSQQTNQNIQTMPNSQLAMAAKFQAMQAWALERNIDLSASANPNPIAQLVPNMQSRMASQQKPIDSNANGQPLVASENSPCGNSSSDVSGGLSGSGKARQMVQPSPFGSTPPSAATACSAGNNLMHQQFSTQNCENQVPQRLPAVIGNGMSSMRRPQPNSNASQDGPEMLQMQYPKLNRFSPQPAAPSNDGNLGNQLPSQAGPANQTPPQQNFGFTRQQLQVLKAQILAFRRLKKGDGILPQELLRGIAPPPLESQLQCDDRPAGTAIQDRSAEKNVQINARQLDGTEKDLQTIPSVNIQKANGGDLKDSASTVHVQGTPTVTKGMESVMVSYPRKEEQQGPAFVVKSEQDATPIRSDLDRGKAVAPQDSISDTEQVKKPGQTINATQPKDAGSTRKYHGPLFDFPVFTRKHDSFGSAMVVNNGSLALAYDVKDLLFEEGTEVFQKKRTDNINKIGGLLAVNLERKRISPDIILRLQIEEKKLRLLDLQARVRDEVDQNQQEIMTMADRPYRKFVRQCERQRAELARQVQITLKATREKQLKLIFQWRKKLLESHWALRDARTARNRGVAKYHERTLKEFSKRKDDDRHKRMEALKNNDVERYREMLMEQQTSIPGDAGERYAVLSSFLSQTEEYLHKLGGKIAATKSQQEVDEAANAAAVAARTQGLSEEEVKAAAACAREEVMIRNQFSEMNAPKDNQSVKRYYNLAHAVNERVTRQPSILRAGTLRDYQLVGLQWMLSLYNNKLNGILADEMGLGKTVQVMALIAYLMESKGNYGPHLIVVPNAVLVNWKSELHTWLPSVSCIYYVGGKDERSKLFSQEVCALKFNVLVTTYEFIMYDRSKLSKVDWKYIIIDEAQRMKDRESVLARDLDRYRCQRRLLLTGTPLQNDLKELWSLLNLLLPEVFDNRKAFHDWFSQPFQKETHNAEDDWLETEKKVIVIHRLHQILEPFMLRRRVEDVEGSLPPKVPIVLKCRMSAIQGAIYDWIKTTGTLRVDPEDEKRRLQKNPNYQSKVYKPLNNRCMELRKTCNHPLLNYPYFYDFSKDFLVRSCGKLWILDRILIKLHRTGHRVLLFSTMTKLLDILEEYLQWRRLVYRRIDGTTSLEDRESAIVEFNSPDSECFIFLLSIRAAGRGLNLQSADTVVIYDPDPNPKNEEQAVARAHRIGQTREVKVIYLEAVVDKITSHQKEDEFRSGGMVDPEDDLAGNDRYMGSIESLIRNNIQQYKIDMADEVINAGRFDQRTTHEERRLTLETLLHDEDRFQETVHDVPSMPEVNRMIARSVEEVEVFNQMDEDFDWAEDMMRYDEVPKWLRSSSKEVNATVANLSKKPSRSSFYGGSVGNIVTESAENRTDRSPKTRRIRGRPKKYTNYAKLYDDNGDFSDASSEDKNVDLVHEEEGDVGEEYEETSGAVGAEWEMPVNKDQLEADVPVCDGAYEFAQAAEQMRNDHVLEEAGSSGSSSDSRRLMQTASPLSSQKFGSLSALDARPGSVSKKLPDELEEGEIAASGDSHVDPQQSGSWIHDHDEAEDEQVLQPRIKRKRSIRLRPRQSIGRAEDKSRNEKPFQRGNSSHLPFQLDSKHGSQLRVDLELKSSLELHPSKLDKGQPSSRSRRTLPNRRTMSTFKSSRLISLPPAAEDATEHTRESWDGKAMSSSGTSNAGTKMSEVIQRKCKNVLSKLQRRIDKEGYQIVPMLTDLWKRSENYGYTGSAGNSILDIRKIDQRVDRLEYNGVMGFVSDVQNMLKNALQFFGFSLEVRTEARKVHDLFLDIMKLAFPDSDFREVRNPHFITAPTPSTPPPRMGPTAQTKRHRLINEVDPEPRPRGHMPQKEARVLREQARNDDLAHLAHPGELVICKKRRKEREKIAAGKLRAGPVVLPGTPPAIRGNMIQTPASRSGPRGSGLQSQQGWAGQAVYQLNGGGSGFGWANPVKRMRTDAGKRRPCHF